MSLLLLAVLLQACSTPSLPVAEQVAEELQLRNDRLFVKRPVIPTPQQIFTLTPEQKQALLQHMEPLASTSDKHRELADYMEKLVANFNYQEDTLTASAALEAQRGNCLTLAILATALAQHAGIETGYQLVNDLPVYEFGGSVVLKGVHVRSVLYDPDYVQDPGFQLFSRPGVTIDYFPSGRERFIANIGEQEFIAMYYRNIAGMALRDNDLDKAYWFAQEALHFADTSADTINLLAVINRRKGDEAHAEQLYLYGLDHAKDKLSLLKNYRILLLSQGRDNEARRIELRLSNMDDPSPFHWFQLAQSAMENGELDEAQRYFNKALDLAPYLHEAWLGLAQANYQAGRFVPAKQAMAEALDRAEKISTRQNYKSKLLLMGASLESR